MLTAFEEVNVMSSQSDIRQKRSNARSVAYKKACDDVLLERAKNSKAKREIEFRDGSSLSFLMELANK